METALKVALVHDWLTGMRGGEKCLEVLCRRFPDARLYTLIHRPGSTSPAIERMSITTSFLQRIPRACRHYRYLLPLMPRAVERLAIDEDVDVVVSFSHAVAKSIRITSGAPHVCYCFTPMRYAWHMREAYFGTTAENQRYDAVITGRIRGGIAMARDAVLDRIRDWDRTTSSRVTQFVAVSQTVARRIAECYGRESRVIYPPVDTDFFTPPAPGQPVPREDFYLAVSALVPYKRIELAIAACRHLGRRLVIIGTGPEESRLRRLAGRDVQMLGWQSDLVVREHLWRCRALLFPGQEDFGIVPVEAQACGTPVIALAKGGATETVLPGSDQETGSGLFFSEPNRDSLCEAIERFDNNPTWFSADVARQQALRFRAERFEQQLIDFIEAVARGGLEERGGRSALTLASLSETRSLASRRDAAT